MRTILHIDCNSAYLSWTAVDLLERGYPIDIRTIPSAIAGDPQSRHGIILTKSIPAKAYKIQTGESLFEARRKCPELAVFAPNYDLYLSCSEAMYCILSEYSDQIERYSVDECWLDYTNSLRVFGDPIKTAYKIKDRMKVELGFTVNIGVSVNKLLAKMGSEMQKPDRVHTLYPNEIKEKMWPLPVNDLFFCGRKTTEKLHRLGITTIGEIANADLNLMRIALKPVHGQLMHDYANGIDESPVRPNQTIIQKGVGNSTTIAFDVTERHDAYHVLLALSERIGLRLRKMGASGQVVSVTVRNNELYFYRHQRKLDHLIGTTTELYESACHVFDEMWRGDPIRHLGIHLTALSPESHRQLSMLDRNDEEQLRIIDETVDMIRNRYGDNSIMRGIFANSDEAHMLGGVNDGNYLMMGGYSL